MYSFTCLDAIKMLYLSGNFMNVGRIIYKHVIVEVEHSDENRAS